MILCSKSPYEPGVQPANLIELLQTRAHSGSNDTAFEFLNDGDTGKSSLSYRELDLRARSIAVKLQERAAPGARVMLCYPAGLEYVAALFGCLYAGVIAVPAYPPRLHRSNERLEVIAADAQAGLALTTSRAESRFERLLAEAPGLARMRWFATDDISLDLAERWRRPPVTTETLAYLQYTSGSTATPKGVMVTHANVLHNCAYINQGFKQTSASVGLSWLPHFHDMGLIQGILQPIYVGMLGLLMSPTAFLQQPFGWLRMISEHRVTHSGGPNFAYDLCVNRITAEQRATLDLSHWRVAFNGAEPIRPETLDRFAQTFAPCGFQQRALYPAYGLAEATLKVSGAAHEREPVSCCVRADALEQHRIVESGEREGDSCHVLVSSGQVGFDTRAAIVNPESLAKCAPDEIGEIWVSGPGVAAGYWNRPDETERTFNARLRDSGEGPFLRTGDLGFLRGEELFVTGRLKDLIIIRGRNHYPQDIEHTVEASHADLRADSGAAFAVAGQMPDGSERLVVVQELAPRRKPEPREVIAAIRRAVAETHELQPAAIVLVPAGGVPKTSSGKVRRGECRQRFLERRLDVVAEWWAPADVEPPANRLDEPVAWTSQEEIAVWITLQLSAILGCPSEEIDVRRPLTEYGVDSLLAVELSHRLEVALGIVVPMADLLSRISIADLAARAWSSRRSLATPVANDEAVVEHPLSIGQQALWYIHAISPASAAYTIANAARIRGGLDVSALRRAFQGLVNRHACLRSTFSAALGEPAQLVHTGATVAFDYEDAATWDEAPLSERLAELAHHPFDLESGPLLRLHLFRRTETEHVLLFYIHHIVADFWSLAVLMSELGVLYDAEKDGRAASLPPLAYQYADYVGWQKQMLAGAEGERLWAYWQQQLAGDLPALSLPTDRPRPPLQTYRGAAQAFCIPAELTAELKALGRRHDATLYAVLLAIFQTLLHRYSNQDNILVGSPTTGRSRAGFADLVGYFVNPVVMRADFAATPSFAEFLERTRQTALQALAHQDYPFALLVKRLQTARDASRSPLFQAMFVLHKSHLANAPGLAQFALGENGARLRLGSLDLESCSLDMRVAQFDLTLAAAELEAGLAFSLEYNADLFDAATIARMAERFQTLIESVTANPECPVADLPFMRPAEAKRLLIDWNDTAGEFPVNRCIHDLFAAQAERTPDAIAVSDERQQLSYGQLNERAERLATHLRQIGIGPESRVAVYVSRSVEMIIGLLGAVKAGGAYVPLDAELPRERLAFIIADAQVAAVLTERRMADRLTGIDARVIYLDQTWQTSGDDQPQPRRVLPGNIAYIIYTSGSTGRPKGVMIPHEGLVNYIDALGDWPGVAEPDRVLQFAAIGFDSSAEEIFVALTRGSRLVLRSPVMMASAASFIDECRRSEITVLDLPTAYWHELVMNTTKADWAELASLRLVIIGGERALAERLLAWRQIAAESVRLVNAYGPTETTIAATLWDASGELPPDLRDVPIGRPVRNMQAYILDARLHATPIGLPGELCLAGNNLARGYLNRPDVTAAQFIPHPLSGVPGARLYRTGDVARWRSDGEIECLGRDDQQVKVRGYRIELSEIEITLRQHPLVDEAVVLAKEAAPGRNWLVAYARSRDAGLTGENLRAFLKQRLPDYMIPAVILRLDDFPKTNSGKVDRCRLPEPGNAVSPILPTAALPQTDAERRLAEIWADVLNLANVGVHDNFFELGGDSILSIQILARARQAGLRLSAKQMLAHPTIAQLAAVATNERGELAEQGPVTGDVPLTPIQRWFFEQSSPDVNHWNMAVLFETSAPLIPAFAEGALSHLLAHHDALRLRFTNTPEGWRQQIVAADDHTPFAVIDLSGVPASEREAALRRSSAATQTTLDLAYGPLIRVLLFDLGEGRANRLLMIVHHLAVDAISWRILLEDFETAYKQLERGEPVRLPLKTASFKQWAHHLAEASQTSPLREQAAHWLACCEDAAGSLPIDFAAGENREGSARTLSVSLDEAQTRRLLYAAPRAYHAEINDLLLTAVAEAFARWTGDRALTIEVEGHGREELQDSPDLSRTVGWFTSAFPVKLALQAGSAPSDALKTIREQRRRIPHRGIGYGILRYLNAEPSIAEALRKLPSPGVSFNYVGRLDEAFAGLTLLNLIPVAVGPLRCPDAKRSHLIEIDGGVRAGRLQFDWTYSSNLHRRETIAGLAQDFLHSLERLIEYIQPANGNGYSPADFPLAKLDPTRLAGLLDTFSDVEDVYTLSPAQQGLLFHSLYAPHSAMYVAQLALSLCGNLDAANFACAWQQVIDRHAALRTTFAWEGLDEPLQIVHQSARLSLIEADWRTLSPAKQGERLEAFLQADREQDFDLSASPPMRFALLRLGDEAYEFIWSHHHLLLDGWSFSTILAEAFSMYELLQNCKPVQLPPERPYRDYIKWLNEQSVEQAESFWRATLKGFTTATPLPFEHRAARAAEDQPARLTRSLTAPSTARLQAMVRQEHLTLNTLVQAAWAILLARHAGANDLVFGATVSGRPPELPGVETMIGLFINTLPVRVNLSPDETTLTLMKRLRVWLAEAQQYEYSLLVKIQEWSEVARGTPLFNSILVFENYPLDAAALKKRLSFDIQAVRSFEKTNYPLTLVVMPADELRFELLYDRDYLDAASVARLLDHLQTLVESIAANPEQRVAELDMLNACERHEVIVAHNNTASGYPTAAVHALFEQQARRTPDAIAVASPSGALSYGELNARANQLARYLRANGVVTESAVGIALPRSADLIIALLAVLKAGGVCLPFDMAYPQTRLRFMMEDTGASLLLTSRKFSDSLPAYDGRVVYVDHEPLAVAAEQAADLDSRVQGEHLAYVFYTSGSTGTPKGAAIPHRAINRLVRDTNYIQPGLCDSFAQLSSASFDAALFEIWGALLNGGRLTVIPSDLALPPARLAESLSIYQVSTVFLTTALFNELARQTPHAFQPLKMVLFGGETADPKWVREALRAAPACRFLHVYGPTEGTTYSTFDVVESVAENVISIPIGVPISNARAYVLGESLEPLPAGVAGELYIGGAGLARGYFNRPDVTAERFIPDPFAGEPDARFYQTGDVVRRLADLRLDYLGRKDHQVKLRGFRIELGEIETALRQIPGVDEAVVLLQQAPTGDKALVAYLTYTSQPPFPDAALRQRLSHQLPGFMVPAAFVTLASLPLTANGKVDRAALRGLPHAAAAQTEFTPPRNAVEESVAAIWTEILGVEAIGCQDNFFELGGHSLLATRVTSAIRRVFKMELPLKVLFESATVEQFAAALSRNEAMPGQVEKIARVYMKMRRMSADERETALRQKRGERN